MVRGSKQFGSAGLPSRRDIESLLVWKRWQIPAPRATLWYAAGFVASFVLFRALLRWQIWESRHHAPLFALGSAIWAREAGF
ncbi:MAG: hypothetical protein DLM68_04435 [Hyphomicrobiales bacterium]|nr:MAG: hypothetical protein DLM68_04435 [Hyphomicrobiales bacterium]